MHPTTVKLPSNDQRFRDIAHMEEGRVKRREVESIAGARGEEDEEEQIRLKRRGWS